MPAKKTAVKPLAKFTPAAVTARPAAPKPDDIEPINVEPDFAGEAGTETEPEPDTEPDTDPARPLRMRVSRAEERGLQTMMQAISASPKTIAEILGLAERIRQGALPIAEAVDGLVCSNEADDCVAEEDFDEFDDAADDDGPGGSKALTKKTR